MSALVLAKAPVPGRVKTRLGDDVGMETAAALAAAALLDTIETCTWTFGADRCHLALDGDLADGVRFGELREALRGWTIRAQQGDGLAERIAQARLDLAGVDRGPVVQIGMDTPQVTVGLLRAVAERSTAYDAVLGPADDGGWWVLATRDPASVEPVRDVPMSSPETHDRTRDALVEAGLSVGAAPRLRDVDTAADAAAVADLAPRSRFAQVWRHLVREER